MYDISESARMKIDHFFRWLLLLLLSFGAGNAIATEANNVRIEFVHPERFSDFRIQGREERQSVPIFRDEISSYLSPNLSRRFPGAKLTLKFTDIDLAARLEPWRISKFTNVRFARDIGAVPLRFYFDYTLTDSKNRVVASGSASVVDTDYIARYNYYSANQRSQTLFYEKVTLARWLNSLNPATASVVGK
jgi:DUF3016 family protein